MLAPVTSLWGAGDVRKFEACALYPPVVKVRCDALVVDLVCLRDVSRTFVLGDDERSSSKSHARRCRLRLSSISIDLCSPSRSCFVTKILRVFISHLASLLCN